MDQNEIILKIGSMEGKLDLAINMLARLDSSFHALESGRLSKLEVDFATLHTNVASKARNQAIVISIIASIIGSVASGLILFLLLHIR